MRHTHKISEKKKVKSNSILRADTPKKKTDPASLTVSHGGIPVGRHKNEGTFDYTQSNKPNPSKKRIYGGRGPVVGINIPEDEQLNDVFTETEGGALTEDEILELQQKQAEGKETFSPSQVETSDTIMTDEQVEDIYDEEKFQERNEELYRVAELSGTLTQDEILELKQKQAEGKEDAPSSPQQSEEAESETKTNEAESKL